MAHQAGGAAASDKGLSKGAVGLLGGVVLGISCVAPAYTLTVTLGYLVPEVGAKAPVVFIAGFLPMFFAAYAYRELNRANPDCGTSFTWATKAFGPVIGWLTGWTAVLATVIVLSNLAGVAAQFAWQLLGSLAGSGSLAAAYENPLVNVATCLAFLAVATAVAYRGIETNERVQYVLVAFQMAALLLFAGMAIAAAGPDGLAFSWSWFNPFEGLTLQAIVLGLSLSIFAFWGWDAALTVNEESKDAAHNPGRAALLAVLSILLTYVLVSVAAQMYAGTGDTGLGLSNEETADNVFGALAEPVMGTGLSRVLLLAVLASSAASLMSTFLPTTRTLLAMGTYRAVPGRFAQVHHRHRTPQFATLVAGVVAGLFYAVMTLVSSDVLEDTILALGLFICFYYSLTAFACVWWFRESLFASARNVLFRFLLPLVGGLSLAALFVLTLRDSAAPDYGSTTLFGVGIVACIGVGLILAGAVLMLLQWRRDPAFFRSETLRRDTPGLVVD